MEAERHRSTVISGLTKQLKTLTDAMRECKSRFDDSKVVLDQYCGAVGLHQLEVKRLEGFLNHLKAHPYKSQTVGCWTCYLILKTTKAIISKY